MPQRASDLLWKNAAKQGVVVIAALVLAGCWGEPEVAYSAATAGTHDCAKAQHVSIDVSGQTFKFVATCGRILINGANNQLTIEAAKSIDINGPNNVIEIDAVDDVKMNSTGNTVTYKRGLTRSTATVVAAGDNNKIIQSK
jgi:hypothetical protein